MAGECNTDSQNKDDGVVEGLDEAEGETTIDTTIGTIVNPAGAKAAEDGGKMAYLVSFRLNAQVSCLHKMDGCWRAKGQKFNDFALLPEGIPKESSYTSYCKDCWPKSMPWTTATTAPSSSSSASSSSSSS